MKQKVFSMFALLLMAATGAWAQTETLLTTITATGETTYSETTAGVVTVTPSGQASYNPTYGWLWDGSGSVTVEAKEGYTITKCVFKQNAKTPVTITTSPFAITFAFGKCEQIEEDMDGFTSIEVYGYAPATTGYSVTLAEGTEDEGNWTISPTEAAEGSPITATYSGEKKVKSVKAVKVAAVNPNAYLMWDKDQKKLVATEIPTTATKVENADAGVEWQVGTDVVEGEDVKINGSITLSGDVNLIIKDDATLTANKIIGGNKILSIYGQAQKSGQLVVDNLGDDATTSIKTLEVHSAKVTATSSYNNRGGFYYIGTINVYDGSVDAIAANGGYGIWLRPDGSINIYGGEVNAVGKGTGTDSFGIKAATSATVTVNGGKLWAENANKQAINTSNVTLKKGDGFTGKIETSANGTSWTEYTEAATPTTKYVRAGY